MIAVLSPPFERYGAAELRRAARPDMVRALLLSSVLVTLAFAVTLALSPYMPSHGPIVVEVPPPRQPEGFQVSAPPRAQAPPVAPTPARAENAVPQVVDDPLIPTEPASTGGPSAAPSTETTGGAGRTSLGNENPGDGPLNQPGEVPFVEQLPVAIQRVTPRYPPLALEAGAQGTVVVFLLVGKDGRVKDARLHPQIHQPLLDDAALEAARAWTFEPALVNGRPVAVWVSLPFRFAQH